MPMLFPGHLGTRRMRRENSVEDGVGTHVSWAPCPRQTLARVPWPLSHIVAQGGDPYYPPVIETCDSHKIEVQVRAGRLELLGELSTLRIITHFTEYLVATSVRV